MRCFVGRWSALMAARCFEPVGGGLLWKRATKGGAIAAMVGGVTMTMGWKLYGLETIDPVLPGFLGSALLLVAVRLLTPPPPSSATAPYFEKT